MQSSRPDAHQPVVDVEQKPGIEEHLFSRELTPGREVGLLHGWPIPSSLSENPEEARRQIRLPEFEPLLLEKARVISSRFPFAEAQYRYAERTAPAEPHSELPHFERVFLIASQLASVRNVQQGTDYDALLVLTAWYCVRPGVPGFLSSYPKALLCSLSHCAPPTALAALTSGEQSTFERRAPTYLRHLLCTKFGLQTCADIENADLRHLLRSAGFRLIRSSAVAEVAFPGITRGGDPPVRPWKLTLRQELSDERAADLLITAALWKIKHDLRLVKIQNGVPCWNIGAFARTDWEDAFLSLGVRIAPSLLRESGLFDWRAVLTRCIEQIGQGNLPPEVLGRVAAWPQRICHDSQQEIWEGLDQISRTVMQQVQSSEPALFQENGDLNYEMARTYRRWARRFDEVSPQILSRLGVSAFNALHRVAPEYFGWGCHQLKPWELEQEYGKWKGPRGRALLRSAYAFALYETGLGSLNPQEGQVIWQCTLAQFSDWQANRPPEVSPYDFLYAIASRHGLTPLLSREVSHTAAVSLLAGVNLHDSLPRIEGCWEICLRAAIEHHAGKLQVRLVLPDLVPLPLRLRKALLTPLSYSYLHKELRLVRDFDQRMAREAHCKLEELPGWWEDERIAGTPLESLLNEPGSTVRAALEVLRPEPWLEPPTRRVRFRALYQLISKQATSRTQRGQAGLNSQEIRALIQFACAGALEHSNIVQVSVPAIRRGFERILAREDSCEMLDSLLLHIGTAYETEIWGSVRKVIVLDVINDLVALAVRNSLLHLMSSD